MIAICSLKNLCVLTIAYYNPNCARGFTSLLDNIHEDGEAEEMYAYHAIREKLCHKFHYPGYTLDLKTKNWIGSDQTLLFISQSITHNFYV